MTGRKHGKERLTAKEQGGQPKRVMGEDRSREADGEPALRHHFPNTFRRAFFQDYCNTGITAAEFPQDPPQKGMCRWTDIPKMQFSFFASSSSLNAPDRFFKPLQQQC